MPSTPVHTVAHPALQAMYTPRITDRQGAAATQARADGTDTEGQESAAGVILHISPAGIKQAQASQKNQDIDDSDLPDTIKDLLKMIRELKAKVQERTQALQQLMADTSLSDEERSLQTQQLQAEIATLSGALATAMGQLTKAIKEADLSDTQASEVAKLLA